MAEKELRLGYVRGRDGKSPYEAAVEEGYTGTEAEFYAALVSLKDAPFLSLSGGTMTGDLCLKDGVEIKSLGQDEHSLVFEQGGIRLKDNSGVWGARILGLDAPDNNDEAATKGYVDDLVGDIGALLDTINGEVI